MVHRYVRYNGHEFTIRVSFMINVCMCVCVWEGGGLGSNDFVTKIQSFPMNGHYRMYVISGVGHPRSYLIIPLMLRKICSAMTGALALYCRSLRIASTLLIKGNIFGRPYC
jgi:hypothetical protein